MIVQPVIPRVPIALQASDGVTIDPVTGIVSVNVTGLSQAASVQLFQAALASLSTVNPNINGVTGVAWNNGGTLAFV